jgi:hypothetical protein
MLSRNVTHAERLPAMNIFRKSVTFSTEVKLDFPPKRRHHRLAIKQLGPVKHLLVYTTKRR